MMQVINVFAVGLLVMHSMAFADTDPECLNHLGGGMSDVQCYAGLMNDIMAKNKTAYADLARTIPKNNRYAALLRGYMHRVDENIKDCELARQAMNQWATVDDTPTMTPHHDYDVMYYQCGYETRKRQAEYLKLLWDLDHGN